MHEFEVPAVARVDRAAALPDLVVDNAERAPHAAGYSRQADTGWTDVTNAEFLSEVRALARGMVEHGVGPGDRVAIMSRTRYEWTLCDFAVWTAGAVPVPIYDSSSPDQVAWIISDSQAVACVVESPRHRKVLDQVVGDLPGLRHVWVITDGDLDTVAASGALVDPDVLDRRREHLDADTLATIIYTSGTTGRPKGCELTHGNFLDNVTNIVDSMEDVFRRPGASTLLFLPLAHVFAREIQVGCVYANVRLAHTPTITDLVGKLRSFRPTFLLAVPRVFEKVYNGAQQKATADGRGGIFDRAAVVAERYSRALDGRGPGPILRAQHAVFDRLVYAKLRAAMGGQVEWAISGGAPLGERLGHFFRGIGTTILEGYGLTETTGGITVNTPDDIRVGSVGRPVPGCIVRIEDDGEVLIRGHSVFRGYHGDPDATAEVLDAETGWFSTGDLGELDEHGFLRITGRKKDIIVTAGGKNVAPAPLEDVVRSHPLVSQVVVVGDNRPYVAAVVTLDDESVRSWLGARGRSAGVADLIDDPEVRADIQTAIDRANRTVSNAEAIKRFVILPVDFTEESGHLTPSLKVKRGLVTADFTESIESLYD